MRTAILLAGCVALASTGIAHATLVNADYAVALNGGVPIFGDAFDGAALSSPPWVTASGSPGPVSGGFLSLHGGDTVLAGVPYNPIVSQQAQTSLDLASFGAGSVASLLLLGAEPNQVFSLSVAPGLVGVFSDASGPLAFAPVTAAPGYILDIVVDPAGAVSATINNEVIFTGAVHPFTATAVGLSVVPEPATVGMLLAGGLLVGRRRLMSRVCRAGS